MSVSPAAADRPLVIPQHFAAGSYTCSEYRTLGGMNGLIRSPGFTLPVRTNGGPAGAAYSNRQYSGSGGRAGDPAGACGTACGANGLVQSGSSATCFWKSRRAAWASASDMPKRRPMPVMNPDQPAFCGPVPPSSTAQDVGVSAPRV